jgi:egghead protein (zeste-white 4 protein)
MVVAGPSTAVVTRDVGVDVDDFPTPAASQQLRPGVLSFFVVLLVALGLAFWFWQLHDGPVGVIGWATTVVWTLPLSCSLIGIAGGARTIRMLRTRKPVAVAPIEDEALVVIVPTIGRWDTLPALRRVVESFCEHLPPMFRHLRVEIVIEEGCEAEEAIRTLKSPLVSVITVPASYRTPAGTRFKARANHYAIVRRIARKEARDVVWILHMDDDTGVGPDTAREIARFITEQRGRGDAALHLAQGVLTYPREHAARRLLWLADATRPAQDISLYAITTGRGSPHAGLHGELLLVRASVEATIGWDFGPQAVVEDTQFALLFAERYPGRSGWFPGCSYGATPVDVGDFLRQRERWARGLLDLAVNGAVPLRHRLLLMHNMFVWSWGPLQHLGVILAVGLLLGDLNTFPVTALLLPVWAVNVAYQAWIYWEGVAMNAAVSASPRCPWWERLATLALFPLFSFWEMVGFFRGFIRFVRHGETTFTVIAKPL